MVFKKTQTLEERFDDNVLRTSCGCWVWLGLHSPRGYGRIKVDKKEKRAHKVSYELHKGKVPEGKLVCHSCDIPCCVNPDHLWLGTAKQNSEDMCAKNRQSHAESRQRNIFGQFL